MPHYYFDWKDGITKRDRVGVELPDDTQAIQKAQDMAVAAALSSGARPENLRVSITREDGTEVEQVPVPEPKTTNNM